MGILQEAAILAGDLVTQPIRARIASGLIGKPIRIERTVEEGTWLSDGSISSWPPHLASFVDHRSEDGKKYLTSSGVAAKRVSWRLVVEETEKKR